jgi:membrane protein required for colicin V production
MTAFDYIVLTILVCSVIVSMVRGLVKEVLSLLAWIFGFIAANLYGPWMAQQLPDAFPGTAVRMVAGFLIVLIGVVLLVGLINMAIGSLIRVTGLTVADRGLGGLFGFARGVVIVIALVIAAGFTTLPRQPVWRDAALSPLAETAVRTIKPLLPDRLAAYVKY